MTSETLSNTQLLRTLSTAWTKRRTLCVGGKMSVVNSCGFFRAIDLIGFYL